MKLVYVAGPYTNGDVAENIGIAAKTGLDIMAAGHAPFVPHTHTHTMAQFEYHDHEEWMQIDLMIVERCDAVFRLPGNSQGADQEESFALACGIPVFTVMDDLIEWCGHGE